VPSGEKSAHALLRVNAQSPARSPAWRRYVAWAVVHAVASAAGLASLPIIFGSSLPQVHIQWRDVSQSQRIALERRFALTEATDLGNDVWSYVPTDTSRERLLAIVTDAAVADTNGINRRTFRISDTPPLTARRGGLLEAPPWMTGATRLLAYVMALMSAVFFMCATLALPILRPGSPVRRSMDARMEAATRTSLALLVMLRARRRHVDIPDSVVAAAVALFGVTLAWRFLTFTGFTNDHYVHLALAQQMLMGERPIRDFADSGWPLMYLLSAAAWRLTGDTLATEWSIAAGWFALGAACTVVAAYRLSASLSLAVIVTIVEGLIYPRTYSYPKVLAYGAASWAMVALAGQPSRRRIVIMSAVVAIAFLFRHDHGLFIGIGAAVCLFVAGGAKDWRGSVRRTAVLTATTAALLLPWTAFVVLNGGLFAYFQGGIEYSRAEADATALASLPTLHLASPLSTIANAEAWLFWLFWGLVALCGVILFARVLQGRERWTGESAAVAGLVTLAALVNASFLRETLQVRLPDAIVPVAVLGAWALGLCWIGRWRVRALQLAVQLATVVVLTVSLAAISRIADLPGLYDETDIGRGFTRASEHARDVSHLLGSRHRDNLSPPSRVSRALMPFVAYLDRCTAASDRLLVTGEFPELLVIAGRGFAGDGVVFGSWYASETHQDRTVQRLQARPPLFVLHAGDYAGFRGRFGLVDAFVSGAYEAIAELPVEGTNSVRILAHRSRTPTRTDPQTGWGCYR